MPIQLLSEGSGTTTLTGLETLSSAFEWIIDGFSDFASDMLSTPLFLIPVAIFCAGACIGLVKRLV